MFRCPNCGGAMVYSISRKALYCTSCRTTILPEDYKGEIRAEEHKVPSEKPGAAAGTYGVWTSESGQPAADMSNAETAESGTQTAESGTQTAESGTQTAESGSSSRDETVTVYTCRSCGAQLVSPDDSLVSYCVYCGSEQLLQSRAEKSEKPAKIIPFQLTRKKCRNKYGAEMKKLRYLPDEFRDADHLDKFVGMYIPYWKYNVVFDGELPVEISSRYRNGSTIVETTYEGTASTGERPYSIFIDASEAFDDTIASHIAPFKMNQAEIYYPGYLAGFFADRPSVAPEFYEKEAEGLAAESVYNQLLGYGGSTKDISSGLSFQNIEGHLKPRILDREVLLFPVWFLTWRSRDRVAYSVMNGQTGEMSADLPVDNRKYLRACLITAAALFVIFSLFLTVTAPTALTWTMVMTSVIMVLFEREMRQLRDRENHVYDPAARLTGRRAAKRRSRMRAKMAEENSNVAEKRVKSRKRMSIWIVLGFLFLVFLISLPFRDFRYLIAVICPVIGTVSLIRSLPMIPQVQEKLELCVQVLTFLALGYSGYLILSGQFEDLYFYGACIACLVSALLTSFALMRCYNLLVTRPVPSFFTREGGGEDA